MEIEKEAKTEGDLVQGDFMDSYHNLSYKNVMGKLWASNFCPQAVAVFVLIFLVEILSWRE